MVLETKQIDNFNVQKTFDSEGLHPPLIANISTIPQTATRNTSYLLQNMAWIKMKNKITCLGVGVECDLM